MESSTGDKKKIGGFLVYERRRRKGTKSGKSISNPNENTSSHSESCPAKTDGELKHAIAEDGAIAKKLAELSVKDKEDTTIVGGENSVAAVQKVGPADKMSHTASGASSELLEEKSPPGVLALNDAEQK